MKRLLSVVALCFLTGSANAAQTLFAVAPWDMNGSPFHSPLESGRFVESDPSSGASALLQAWSNAKLVRSMDRSGKVFTSTVAEVSEFTGDLGDRPIQFTFAVDPAPERPVLLWAGDANVEFVRASPVTLAASTLSSLQQNSRTLVSGFVARRGKNLAWTLKAPTTLRVAGTTWVVATTPVAIDDEGSKDDRGWVFQVLDSRTGKIAWQHFGHPEWTSENSGVLEVTAALFFRIAGNSQILMLGEHGSGWESSEWAIYDLTTGTALSISN